MPSTVSERVAHFATELKLGAISEPALDVVRRMVLDTIGVGVMASGLASRVAPVLDVLTMEGGAAECKIWGRSTRLPASAAAMANGALAHAFDYDDFYEEGLVHVGSVIVPVALAAAEARPEPVPGSTFVEGLTVGAEVLCRLGLATRLAMDPGGAAPTALSSQVLGYLAGSLTAARILGLTAAQAQSAMSLALMQSAGTMEIVHAVHSAGKAIYAGFACHGATVSARLAQHGLEARAAAIEGQAGLIAHHYGGAYKEDVLLDGLGKEFVLEGLSFKPWPSSRFSHGFIEAALELRDAIVTSTVPVRRIVLRVDPIEAAFCEPIEDRRRPPNSEAAKNSIPYCVGLALSRSTVSVEDFSQSANEQTDVHGWTDRIHHVLVDAGTDRGLAAELDDGRVLERRIAVARGHPNNPLEWKHIVDKFQENLAAVGRRDAGRIIQDCEALAGLDDVKGLAVAI